MCLRGEQEAKVPSPCTHCVPTCSLYRPLQQFMDLELDMGGVGAGGKSLVVCASNLPLAWMEPETQRIAACRLHNVSLYNLTSPLKMNIFSACSGRDLLLLMAIRLNGLWLGVRMLSNTRRTIMKFNVL